MGRSILEDLGQEVTGIAAPVSICMAITVALVRLLNPNGASDSGAVYIASVYYTEDASDSTGQKLSGSVINALIFVGIIGFMTFILVLLFKYGCTKIIYAYMGFSGFSIFFVLTGIIVIELLQKAGAHMDWISLSYILWNFAMVGAVTLFFFPAPLLMKQCYLVVTGVAVAFVFTWIPEWTTWVLLVAMALYDILAVLIPGGPLKVLVELAEERDEDIPALVYQARSSRRDVGAERVPETYESLGLETPVRRDGEVEMPRIEAATNLSVDIPAAQESQGTSNSSPSSGRTSPAQDGPRTPLIPSSQVEASHASSMAAERIAAGGDVLSPQSAPVPPQMSVGAGVHLTAQQAQEVAAHPSEATAFALPEAIKLGLGDFIFYSVLVGRAAMYDMLTVFSCYLAIIAGLGCTLLWLAIAHKALPALPISIALAVIFYFVSRFVLEPVILPMTLRLVFF